MLRAFVVSLCLCAAMPAIAQNTPAGWQPGDSKTFVLDKGEKRVIESYNVGVGDLPINLNFSAVSPTDIYVMTRTASTIYFQQNVSVNTICGEQKLMGATFSCIVPAFAGVVDVVVVDRRKDLSFTELVAVATLFYGRSANIEDRLRAPNQVTITSLVRVPTPEEIAAANAPQYRWHDVYKNKAAFTGRQVRAINLSAADGDHFRIEFKANSPIDIGVLSQEKANTVTSDAAAATEAIGNSNCARQDSKKASFQCTVQGSEGRKLVLVTSSATQLDLKIRKLDCVLNCDKK